ncbi:ABC transporter substrate-binding protein [bacterium]|nr:ABC transporter substrate-binding protein [bacterium]
MKVRFFIFVFIVVPVFLTNCSTLETNETPANPDWEDVEATYNSLESAQNFAEIESYSKELSAFKWAKWQTNHINFMLASSLFRQNRNAEALEIFKELRYVQPFAHMTHRMAGEAALAEKKYEDAIKWVLSVYLKLSKEEKIPASKTVFLAYLYSKRLDTAAIWYRELDDTKKANLQPELDDWLNESEENRRNFNDAVNGNVEMAADDEQPKNVDEIIKEAEKIAKEEEEAARRENASAAAVFEFDESYVPDWKKLCVALSSNDRWTKYNEVIKTYINWHLSKYDKSGVKPEFLEYDDEKGADAAMKKAKEIKCFAVIGPFFAPEFADNLIEKSAEHSIPVISYIPFIPASKSLFFNIMPTKDLEAENLVKYAVSERERKKFAIAYIDDFNGRNLRDVYWRTIEESGGEVTDIINISPADNAYMDDVEKVVGKQENYDEAIRAFRWRNKEKFTTDTMMKRAVERFIKTIPGKCAFDTLVVLTPPAQTAMLLPSFPYLNVEFAYYQNYLNRAVAVKKQEVRKEGFDWDIQQILVLGPSEIVSSAKSIEQLDKLIDGMVVFAPKSDTSEKNKKYMKIAKAFKNSNGRAPYFAETIAAEVVDTVLSALAASQKIDMGDFVETLKSTQYSSVLSGKTVKFDEKQRMTGRSMILIGRNNEPFMTPAEIEEDTKRKTDEKLKEGKSAEQEDETSEN